MGLHEKECNADFQQDLEIYIPFSSLKKKSLTERTHHTAKIQTETNLLHIMHF